MSLNHKEGRVLVNAADANPALQRTSRGFSLHLRAVDVFLIIALAAALFGGGYAYAQQGPDMLTGILAIIGIVCLLCMVIAPFISRASAPPRRYKVTPLSRNPLTPGCTLEPFRAQMALSPPP